MTNDQPTPNLPEREGEAGATPQQPQPQTPAPGEALPPSMEDQVAASLRKRGCGFYAAVAGVVVLVLILLTTALTAWWYQRNFNAKPFKPVELTPPEQEVLDEKIEILGGDEAYAGAASVENGGIREVKPELAEEERLEQLSRERRTVIITEREINAMLNHNTTLGERVKIRFYDGGVGAEANVPVDEEVPIFGGKTLRGKVAVAAYMEHDGGLAIVVRDVTVGGVPLPNEWLGGIKGTNLAEDYQGEHRFLGVVASGIEEIEVEKGELRILLKE